MSNADKANPGIPIKCSSGITRNLIFDLKAFNVLEDYFAKEKQDEDYSIFTDFPWQKLNIRNVKVLLWAALTTDGIDNNRSVTIEEAQKEIDVFGILKSRMLIAEALKRAMPGIKEIEAFAKFIEDPNENPLNNSDTKKKEAAKK